MTFPHPETGELLDSREDFQEALAEIEERMIPFYRLRRQVREAAAEAWGPAKLPRPSYRTPIQDRVARCPRCGGRIESEEAAG